MIRSPGKQLPTGLGKESAQKKKRSKDKETDENVSWSVRDMYQILYMQRQCSKSKPSRRHRDKEMLLSADFGNVDTVLERIRRDKFDVARQSFDVAAASVLNAIRENNEKKADNTHDNNDYLNDLPEWIKNYKKLEAVRTMSFDRVLHHKEYVFKSEATTSDYNTSTVPKFTRNTPASSAAALDARFNSSRAILCVAGNITFEALTPSFELTSPLDPLDIPHNPNAVTSSVSERKRKRKYSNASNLSGGSDTNPIFDGDESDTESTENAGIDETGTKDVSSSVNMGVVSVEAKKVAQRAICVVENAMKRVNLRYQYRKDNAKFRYGDDDEYDRTSLLFEYLFSEFPNPEKSSDDELETTKGTNNIHKSSRKVKMEESSSDEDEDEMFSMKKVKSISDSDDHDETDFLNAAQYQPNEESMTRAWKSMCLPRFLAVLESGTGHAIYHDIQWSSRHGRIADLLRALTKVNENYGPHFIITTEPELVKFGQEFQNVQNHLPTAGDANSMQALIYRGSATTRTRLRSYFSQANGLVEAPFHVLLTSYATFFEDFLHFCQFPFETVILDDAVSFMASCDQNSNMGTIWDSAIFSSNDHHIGLAGTSFKEWDYSRSNVSSESVLKDVLIGLTTRHRIMTASTFSMVQRQSLEYVPVSGLVDFVAPQFYAVVKEDWARSRIAADAPCMQHFRKLVARSMIVHNADSTMSNMCSLSMHALSGKLPTPDRSGDPEVPEIISDEDFVLSSKIASSRRSSLLWLGPLNQSWLRYELGSSSLQHIVEAMKMSSHHGYFCEEITTASSTTASGATGQVAGTMAFRYGVRCGRHFGSEQGLRQHIAAQHAPPGTWLCRTCGSDCVTSQARTHHERSCGQPNASNGEQGGNVGATPTVGQGSIAKGGVGKKKGTGRSSLPQSGTSSIEKKDPDGSFRVPGYRGVWVNKNGKHFVKVDGRRLTDDRTSDGELILFDDIDEAARNHDKVALEEAEGKTIELNFKDDGSRIVYEDAVPTSTSGLGGSAANVVPALSVINIKDLPPDVKPLLRDPRQTSRTGGNSKRHVYAYRGVCRQARKGHDRWQSQISFMGVNHYLGTFDSEWDAAAIYAWAHLILYGEDATRQAQKEGEEAAAAYEQEKKDIAAGKIPEPPPKVEKVKKIPNKKAKDEKVTDKKSKVGKSDGTKNNDKSQPSDTTSTGKNLRVPSKKTKIDDGSQSTAIVKGPTKVPNLSFREVFRKKTDEELMQMAAFKIIAARNVGYCGQSVPFRSPSAAIESLRPCIPVSNSIMSLPNKPVGGAMLLGLQPALFDWDLQDFVESSNTTEEESVAALQLLAVEYDEDGVNEKFQCLLQSTVSILGNVSQNVSDSLGLGRVPIGGVCGQTDCHIGGIPGSCSETSACIRYVPTEISEFQITCLSKNDIVTLNGQRITPDTGSFPLFHEDICVVGARVFAFLLPTTDR